MFTLTSLMEDQGDNSSEDTNNGERFGGKPSSGYTFSTVA